MTPQQPIQTSAGMETATQTADRIQNRLSEISANNVPISGIATPTPSVQLPPVQPLTNEVPAVRSAGETTLSALEAETKARETEAANRLSDSDRRIQEAVGILGTQEQTRSQLETQAGVDRFSKDLTKFQQSLRQQMADLDQFDVDNTNTLEQMRVDASKRDLTKRTFGAMSAEANIQMAVERANKVAQTRATIAAIDVTQGNLQAATQQVDKALKAIYEPVKMGLEMEMMFNQRNFQLFTAAQKEASNARMLSIQRE
jgi:hypothetical protein